MSAPLLKDARFNGAVSRAAAPALPTLIRPFPERPLQADTLDGLARHIHRLRGDRGLRHGKLMFASYAGCDTFPGFNLWARDPDTEAEDWLGMVAIQAETVDALQDALRRTEH